MTFVGDNMVVTSRPEDRDMWIAGFGLVSSANRGASHRQNAGMMFTIVELGLESAGSVTGAVALGASALDHEAGNDSVEGQTIIEPVSGKRDEVVDVIRGDIVPEFDGDRAM